MRIICLVLPAVVLLGGCRHRAERLNGGGSSFVYPVMLKWSRSFEAETRVQVDYQSTGSGNGIQQMTVGTIDFGCTDAPMNAEQIEKARQIGGPVLHVPLVHGGVVPVFNLPAWPEDRDLRLSGPVLAGIFLGSITSWDDPKIAELNPGAALPAQRILVVSRSDPSGTTAIFAEYISKVSPESWATARLGEPGTATRWPVGEAQKGNEGVAGLVGRVPGSIGYVELKFALDVGLRFASVKNRDGAFVRATPETVQAASDAVLNVIPQDLCFSLTDAPGRDSYPIAGTAWAVFYANLDRERRERLIGFLRWATDSQAGQKYAVRLGYAALPERLVREVNRVLDAASGGRP